MSVIARQSGICPLCSKFIAKNLSRIVPLPEPIPPRGNGRFSFDDGEAYYADGRTISMVERAWCHAKCRPRFDEEPPYEDNGHGYPRKKAPVTTT